MNWKEYSIKYSQVGQQIGYPDDIIEELLIYAKKLFEKNIPIIYDQEHFCKLVGYQYELLLKISNCQEKFYRKFSIPKKNGEKRMILEPLPTLKDIQKWILVNILDKIKVHPTSKAYLKGHSIKDNAKFHKNQNKVLNLDIKNFFGTITEKKVYNLFKGFGYNKQVSTLLTQLCCIDGVLPQGAPTSPMISNLVFKVLDYRVFGFCKKNTIRYSRYADDMTFSGENLPDGIISFIRKILLENDFDLNDKKTKIRLRHQRQEVTGIVVNEKLQAKREYRRLIRQQIYYIKRFGIREQAKKNGFDSEKKFLRNLLGKTNFVIFINPKDAETKANIKYLHLLLSEHQNL